MGKHRLSRRDDEQWGGPELTDGSEPTRHAASGERAEAPVSPPAEDGGDPTAVPTGRPSSG